MTIERAIGQLKQRWPLLRHGVRFRNLKDTCDFIIATCVLHNFCKFNGDEYIVDDAETENEELNVEETQENNDLLSGAEKRNAILRDYF